MACFLVPATEAIVTTIVAKAVKSHEAKAEDQTKVKTLSEDKLPLSKKITRLSGFLWGGSGLLAFEHLWHGEVTLFAPFLTAMSNPEDKAVMLHEMATVGVTMSAVVTAVWGIAVAVVSAKFKKRAKTAAQEG